MWNAEKGQCFNCKFNTCNGWPCEKLDCDDCQLGLRNERTLSTKKYCACLIDDDSTECKYFKECKHEI